MSSGLTTHSSKHFELDIFFAIKLTKLVTQQPVKTFRLGTIKVLGNARTHTLKHRALRLSSDPNVKLAPYGNLVDDVGAVRPLLSLYHITIILPNKDPSTKIL
jgi:hypothetical protein